MYTIKSGEKITHFPGFADFHKSRVIVMRVLARCLASLYEGGGICKANDGGSVAPTMGHSPSPVCALGSPLNEETKLNTFAYGGAVNAYHCEGRRPVAIR